MQMISFSVVIPLYNKRSTIIDTLESVKAQRYQPQEIIVVDDGSTDGGAELVAKLNWPNLRLIKQQNKGVSAARNRGIKESYSPYVAFLDADDRWLPFFLLEMRQLIQKFPQQSLFACRYQKLAEGEQFIDANIHLTDLSPDGYVMHNYFELASKGDLPFMISGCVLTRTFLNDIGGFPEDEWMGEDQSVFMHAAVANAIAYSPQIYLLYNIGSENRACERIPPTQACAYALRLMQWLREGRVADGEVSHARRYVAAHLCNLAKRNVKVGHFSEAMALLTHRESEAKPLHRSIWMLCASLGAMNATVKQIFQFSRIQNSAQKRNS